MVVIIAYEPVNKAIFGVFNLGSTSTLYRQYTMYEDPQIIGNSSSNCISYSKVMWNIQDPIPVIKRLMYKNANLEYVKKRKVVYENEANFLLCIGKGVVFEKMLHFFFIF